jgi:hypothetical protein
MFSGPFHPDGVGAGDRSDACPTRHHRGDGH